jgi:hypothetical protein
MHLGAAGAGEMEKTFDETDHKMPFGLKAVQAVPAFFIEVFGAGVGEDLGKAEDSAQGSAEIVRSGGHESLEVFVGVQ